MKKNKEIESRRMNGALIVNVSRSNINGDPEADGFPRIDGEGFGEVSSVSVARKIRDGVAEKECILWQHVKQKFNISDEEEEKEYQIFVDKGTNRADWKNTPVKELLEIFFDNRIRGGTFLDDKDKEKEKEKDSKVKKSGAIFTSSGVFNIGMGFSVAPVELITMTLTNKAGVQEGKDRGWATDGFKVIQHGIYVIPFSVNPNRAIKTMCTKQDIDIVLEILPNIYSCFPSLIRNEVEVIQAIVAEHKSPLGSFKKHEFDDMIIPIKKENPDEPSKTYKEYTFADIEEIRKKINAKSVIDLVNKE